MLKILNRAHFQRVVAFAKKKGLKDFLDEKLDYLRTYSDPDDVGLCIVELGYDFAAASFSVVWLMRCKEPTNITFGEFDYKFFMQGGLIYRGDQAGWAEGGKVTDPLSVLVGERGENPWTVHT